MAAEPILEPIIEPIVIEPALELVPDWVPSPDVPQPYYGPTAAPQWRNVWDWIKDHAILPGGRPITNGPVYASQVQQMIDAATGAVVKAMSGFINQAVQLEVDNFNALAQALHTANAARVADFGTVNERIRRAEVRIHALEHDVAPALLNAIAEADTRAQVRIAQSAEQTRQWATANIFQPLFEDLFREADRANHRMDTQHVEAVDHANKLNANTVLHIGEVVAPVAAAVKALVQESDECVKPMCETLGPKTDLGKLLKAAKIAALAALLVEIGSLRAGGLDDLLGDVAGWGDTAISTIDELFLTGGKTLAETIGALPG